MNWQCKCSSCAVTIVGGAGTSPPVKPGEDWTCEKCTARNDRVEALESRIAALEMQVSGLLEREQIQ